MAPAESVTHRDNGYEDISEKDRRMQIRHRDHQEGARIGIDIGGTFTDFLVVYPDGSLVSHKVLGTPSEPEVAVLKGISEMGSDKIVLVSHATTLATNAVIERRGSRVGFLTTAGFRDTLQIGRGFRYDMQDLLIDLPQALVAPEDIAEIPGRIDAHGQVIVPLDTSAVRIQTERLLENGVQAIAIGFIHSYRDVAHELTAQEIVKSMAPDIPTSTSAEIAPVIREFERFTTTVVNAYLQPTIARYLDRLQGGLLSRGIDCPFVVMLSDGGLAAPEDAAAFPVRMIESGPAAGVRAAAYLSDSLGLQDCLSFDMGGTTAKAALVQNSVPLVTFDSEVARLERFKKNSGLPLRSPSIDLIEIGAGGGSIVTVDELGRVQVGPESTGADPGPAAYGNGGEMATVTDADLISGYLNPDKFAKGAFKLLSERAEAAVERYVAEPLGVDVMSAAWATELVVHQRMADAARIHGIERNIDVRAIPMIAFGGAGPIHACSVAEILGITTVVIPQQASVFSALGLLISPPTFEMIWSSPAEIGSVNWNRVEEHLQGMVQEASDRVLRASKSGKLQTKRFVEMRYLGQQREITVAVPEGKLDEIAGEAIAERFSETYQTMFSEDIHGVPLETVSWRVVVTGEVAPVSIAEPLDISSSGVLIQGADTVQMMFGGPPVAARRYDWEMLEPGQYLNGPARIDGLDTTIVVKPGWNADVLSRSHILLRYKGEDLT